MVVLDTRSVPEPGACWKHSGHSEHTYQQQHYFWPASSHGSLCCQHAGASAGYESKSKPVSILRLTTMQDSRDANTRVKA